MKKGFMFDNSDNIRQAFSDYLNEYIKKNNLSITKVSALSGISYQTLYQWVRGISYPTGRLRDKILKYLGKTEFELFGTKTDDNGKIIVDIRNENLIFSENIRFLIDSKNLKVNDFAKILDVSFTDAISICGGVKRPTKNQLNIISEFFGIECAEDLYSKKLSKEILKLSRNRACMIFASNLRNLIKDKEISFSSISKDLEIPKGTMNGYLNGSIHPSESRIKKFADYLNVPASSLIEDPLEEENKMIIEIVDNIPKDKEKNFLEYLEKLEKEFIKKKEV